MHHFFSGYCRLGKVHETEIFGFSFESEFFRADALKQNIVNIINVIAGVKIFFFTKNQHFSSTNRFVSFTRENL